MLIAGGRRKKNTSLKYRGGAALYDSKGVEGYPRGGSANFANVPTIPPKSTQVGGMGFGYANGADAGIFGGNYFPTSKVCSAEVDPSRGGNNFMSGGKRSGSKRSGGRKSKRSGSKRSGSKRTKGGKRSGSKRSGSKRSGSKRSGSKRSGGTRRKWKQKGCVGGSFIPV